VRALHPTAPAYSFWDYQAGCWERDRGLRIDFALLSPRLAECLVAAAPDRAERGAEQPSDHVPVVVDLLWPRTADAAQVQDGAAAGFDYLTGQPGL
jgi:exodeoxyribonuclease-3